ncbi:DeoR/GlpR family DNA-binding transcription regulator [Halomonas sp. DP5Y7-2]|uniref:DeoR/GlpR family DNA-binding transcription regulator n=1 Tax=Halomonas sp. DP5Y7-2 TaxID=2859076 RepID=UPI001C99ADE0|nr:DeoR/GlpR family DNA-binding transcription regulator [Halomonas sp. DP5Y7-2]MBY5982607.1 DeoR/GlpR family DNA-binding transcription regulator [Halomonas sp. DP5Y7-2]
MNQRSVQRQERLLQALAGGGSLRLADAAMLCGVSEMTLRRDVSSKGSPLMLMGGHLVRRDDPHFSPVYDLETQRDRGIDIKTRLCQRASSYVQDGDTLFIDCGTTLVPMVAELGQRRHLTVVTYALNVANAVSHLDSVRLILLGGLYQGVSQSFDGEDVARQIRSLGINRAFLSAAGVHLERGLSCFHFHEIIPKQAAIETAAQRILVFDDSKWGVLRPAFFGTLSDADIIVTHGEAAAAASASPEIAARVDSPR